jgi:hypothetical protein
MPVSTSTADAGWEDNYRGWYDVQGCGKCNDFCRWVEGTDTGGNPSESTTNEEVGSYWSCRLAGGEEAYTAKGKYLAWSYEKCDHQGASPNAPPQANSAGAESSLTPCMLSSTNDEDPGYDDVYRGWYDIQGCGKCYDFCRWVEGSASGGDPSISTVNSTSESFWSCRLAGGKTAYTDKGLYTEWQYAKCDSEGADTADNRLKDSLDQSGVDGLWDDANSRDSVVLDTTMEFSTKRSMASGIGENVETHKSNVHMLER